MKSARWELEEVRRVVLLRARGITNRLFLSILVLTLSIYWLAFHWPGLTYYWNWDDLHLVRRYSRTELMSVFAGTWDVDHMETPGFRPLTTLFNDGRYVLIGEHPALQRLFLLGLMAALLWLIGWICLQLSLKRGLIGLAFLILVSTREFSGDILWISDGVHIFQNLLLAAAIIGMIVLVRDQKALAAFLSLAAFLAALWTREDSLAVLPISAVLFAAYIWQIRGIPNLGELPAGMAHGRSQIDRRYIAYFGGMVAIALLTFMYRAAAVPAAASFETGQIRWQGFVETVNLTIWIVGQTLSAGRTIEGGGYQAGSRLLGVVTQLWGFGLILTFLFVLFFVKKSGTFGRRASVCLLCLVFASTPGVVQARLNLCFVPTVFFCLLLASTVVEIWRSAAHYSALEGAMQLRWQGRTFNAIHLGVTAVCFLAVVGSMGRSISQDLDMHPLSLNQVWRDYDMIYGGSALLNPTIPPDRLRYLSRKLRRLGLTVDVARSPDSASDYFSRVFADAMAKSRLSPDATRFQIFVPPSEFLAP